MKYWASVLPFSLWLLGAAGCIHGERARTMEPDTAVVTIHNQSGYAICDVYLTPVRRHALAGDRLEASELILPGSSSELELPAGRYDVRINDCAGATLFGRRGVALVGEDTLVIRSVEVQRPRSIRRRLAAGKRPRAEL